MNTLVKIENGKAVTTTYAVAKFFGKEHFNVVRDVESLEVPHEWRVFNFEGSLSDVPQPNGGTRKIKAYTMTRDGFTLLAMGFTGKKAMAFKLAYIEAFNEMEAKLKAQSALPPPPPPKNPIAYLCSPGEYEAHIKMSVKDIPPKADQLSAYSLLDILDGLGYPVERALVEIALMHHYTVYMRGMSEVLELRLLPSLLESLKARDRLYAIGDFKNGTSDIRSGMRFQD